LDGRSGDKELTVPDDSESVIAQPLIYLIHSIAVRGRVTNKNRRSVPALRAFQPSED
jgi:hypothetical protein